MRDFEALLCRWRERHPEEKGCLMEELMKHTRCVGYARSAVGPVDGQVDTIRHHCGSVLDVLREPCRSARDLNRPQLKKLLRLVRRGRVDAVVVARLTALARSADDFAHLLAEFERHDVRLISVAEGIDTTAADAIRSLARILRATDGRKARTA